MIQHHTHPHDDQVICGTNTGHHMMFEPADACASLALSWTAATPRQWDIKISQVWIYFDPSYKHYMIFREISVQYIYSNRGFESLTIRRLTLSATVTNDFFCRSLMDPHINLWLPLACNARLITRRCFYKCNFYSFRSASGLTIWTGISGSVLNLHLQHRGSRACFDSNFTKVFIYVSATIGYLLLASQPLAFNSP